MLVAAVAEQVEQVVVEALEEVVDVVLKLKI
jgi:hypothetical protein